MQGVRDRRRTPLADTLTASAPHFLAESIAWAVVPTALASYSI